MNRVAAGEREEREEHGDLVQDDLMLDDPERAHDLAFLAELRAADLQRLRQIAVNLSFGGPRWQCVAVSRAIVRAESAA